MTWLGFGAPLWLAGLAALALPVAIHLLSRGRQRRVPIGSVRWLAPVATLQARRVRLSRWLLLTLRCAVLAAIVAALALPQLALSPVAHPQSWLLVAAEMVSERARLEATNAEAFARLDELVAAGASLHWLADGVPAGQIGAPPPPVVGELWSWLREADAVAPPGAAFGVFALGRALVLRGVRPALARPVAYYEASDPATNRWIERASAVGDDGLACVSHPVSSETDPPLQPERGEKCKLALWIATSDGASTRYQRRDVAAAAVAVGDGGSPLAVERQAGGWRVALGAGGASAADDRLEVPAPGRAIEAAILFAPERAEDARYLRVALEAVRGAAAVALTIRLSVAEGASALAAGTGELLFWLSPEPVPVAVRRRVEGGAVLVSDALGRFERCDCLAAVGSTGVLSRLARNAEPSAIRATNLPHGTLARFDRVGPVDAGGDNVVLWDAADRRPILTAEAVGEGTWLRYHSRFHPAWTDLVLTAAFPEWLLDLVLESAPPAATARRADSERHAAPGQAAPGLLAAGDVEPRRGQSTLGPWLWLLACGLLAAERWLAARSTA